MVQGTVDSVERGPERSRETRSRGAGRHRLAAAGLAVVVVGASALSACGSSSSGDSSGEVNLKLGQITSFTGDLSSFGPPLDGAVKLAIADITSALAQDGLSDSYSIKLADTQDDQSKSAPAVEAATKEVTVDGANVVIGTLSSTSTIAVAQGVTIPNQAVLISPVASSPSITSLDDDDLVFQMYPNDNFQANELIAYLGKALGTSAKLNVGYRNDEYGNGISKLFIDGWKRQGGSVGQAVSWDPSATSFDDAAQKLVSASPDAWVIFDFPVTFEQVGPALVRTGKWSTAKTYVSAEFYDAEALAKVGAQATDGLHGVAPVIGDTPLQTTFAAHYKDANPSISQTGYEGYAYDAVVTAFLAALEAKSTKPNDLAAHMQSVTNDGKAYTYQDLAGAIKAVVAGEDVKYDGVSGSLNLSAQGAPTAARYQVWQYTAGKLTTVEKDAIG